MAKSILHYYVRVILNRDTSFRYATFIHTMIPLQQKQLGYIILLLTPFMTPVIRENCFSNFHFVFVVLSL